MGIVRVGVCEGFLAKVSVRKVLIATDIVEAHKNRVRSIMVNVNSRSTRSLRLEFKNPACFLPLSHCPIHINSTIGFQSFSIGVHHN
jgi:hypothetical protein